MARNKKVPTMTPGRAALVELIHLYLKGLLATVHWVVASGADSLSEVIKQTYEWNQHKTQFTPRQIEIALRRLISLQWLSPIEGLND